ncbi:hypothetical protein JHK85_042223 [Glycine max]|uniref:NAD(P)H dehydrogenase (quinone) n=1 Tax=Glycine max TaxID=3847 RepID=A0A0R0FXJ4_SOYBN|nr:hypothetical protein JHK85_042223 [Glycine max]
MVNKVYIMYRGIEKGAASVEGSDDVPIIKPRELADADGFLFGFPTTFGSMVSQFKAFLEGTISLWLTQALAGKPVGFFSSTSSQGGGQEETP